MPSELENNNNISFPVGTAIVVKNYSQKLGFEEILSRYKKRGADLVHLIEALISYRLQMLWFSVSASEWINRPDVLEQFSLSAFEERTLFRALEVVGEVLAELILAIPRLLAPDEFHYSREHCPPFKKQYGSNGEFDERLICFRIDPNVPYFLLRKLTHEEQARIAGRINDPELLRKDPLREMLDHCKDKEIRVPRYGCF